MVGTRLQHQQGLGVRWQKTVNEYRSLEKVPDMFGHVANQLSPVHSNHSKKR